MRYFGWIDSVVQSIGRDGKGRWSKNYGKNAGHDNEKGITGYSKELKASVSTVYWTSNPRKAGKFKDDEHVLSKPEFEADSTLVEDTPSQDLAVVEKEVAPTICSISVESLCVRRSSTGSKQNSVNLPTDDSSIAFAYNQAVVDYVSSGRTHQLQTLKRRQVSLSSIVFENSPLAPVTIIVTTPENELPWHPGTPATNPLDEIRSRGTAVNISTTSALMQHTRSMSADSLFTPDRNRLMPPTERQIDHRRLRKAREFREIRRFLIDFINRKADQFPKKLRRRIMDLYSINELDLDPAIVAKFITEMSDEGVALVDPGAVEEGSDADDLRILTIAFRSQIPVVTPTKEQVMNDHMPLSRKTTVKRRTSIPQRPETKCEARKEDEKTRSFVWTGTIVPQKPLTTTESEPSTPTEPTVPKQKLRSSCSEPNMKRAAQSMASVTPNPPGISTTSVAKVKTRNNSLSGGSIQHLRQQSTSKIGPPRSKRQSIFGSIKDAIGGKPAAKKRAMMEVR